MPLDDTFLPYPMPYSTPPAGSNPNWFPGYVPTADEWNSWWGKKLDLTYTATGSTAARSPQDRAGDWVNVCDFGAKLDGTANVDAPAVGAALATLQPNGSLFVPCGNANIVWGSVQGTTPTTPVLFRVDGTTSAGARINRAFSRNTKGDMFENYYQGSKFLSVMSAKPDQPPILHLEYAFNDPGGSQLGIHAPIQITAQDNPGAITAIWGLHVDLDSYSNSTTNLWPQQVGISSSLTKYGKAWCAGMHITAADMQNVASSTGGTLLAFEMGHHANGPDDGGVASSPGLRFGIHLGQSAQQAGGLLPAEFAMGYQLDGTDTSVTKTCFGVTGIQTYQVFDARTATPAPGYASPVAALRMDPGQIIDFNGAPATTKAGWIGPAGNYLQYDTASGKLFYYAGGAAKWSVDASGNMRCAGTVTGSVTP